MGTYSNLIPSAYKVNDGSWTTIKPSVIELNEGGHFAYLETSFVLPASRRITKVDFSFDAHSRAYSASLYTWLIINSVRDELHFNISSVADTISNSFTAYDLSDRFEIRFGCDSIWYIDNIRVNVEYEDPPTVTITGPNGNSYDEGTSFSYSWNVSNGTQTSAVIQESSDGSNWTDKYTISGSTTTKQTSASSVGNHYWRVAVTFSDGTQITSGTGIYSVTEPYVPPEPPTPDNPPTISNISTIPVQPDGLPSTFSSVYIANISKCRVQAAVSAGTNPIREVYFSYPGVNKVSMSYSSSGYVGTTPLALSATTTITVTAVDNTGLYTSDTVNIPVTPYADPTLTINTLYRCNAQGAEDNSGQYYKIKVTAGYSSVQNKNSLASLNAGVKDSIMHGIANGQTYLFGPELPNEDLVYVIRISVTDYVGHETLIERSLSGKLRDVVFKRDEYHKTAHIGVGMTPDGNTRTTVQLPPNGTIIIGGQDLISWLQETLGESFPGWGT